MGNASLQALRGFGFILRGNESVGLQPLLQGLQVDITVGIGIEIGLLIGDDPGIAEVVEAAEPGGSLALELPWKYLAYLPKRSTIKPNAR